MKTIKEKKMRFMSSMNISKFYAMTVKLFGRHSFCVGENKSYQVS